MFEWIDTLICTPAFWTGACAMALTLWMRSLN